MKKLPIVFVLVLAGCRTLPTDPERVPTYALPPAEEGPIAEAAIEHAAEAGDDVNGFRPAPNGHDGLEWRLALIESARVSIDAQYYVWHRDAVGSLVAERVVAAARRGVRVRIIVDDLTLEDQDRGITLMSRQPNIEIRVFNPSKVRGGFSLAKVGEAAVSLNRVNQRMHNKQFIVDNRAAVIGGRNIADPYFGLNDSYNYIDFDVVVVGPAVQELSQRFDDYWNSEIVYPGGSLMSGLDEQDEREVRMAAKELHTKYWSQQQRFRRSRDYWLGRIEGLPDLLDSAPAEVLFDEPETDTPDQVARRLGDAAREAREEVLMVMAYVMPDEHILNWFKELTARGVRVRILTNSVASFDTSAGASFYAAGRRSLVEAGVELHELRPDAEDRVLADSGTLLGESVALHAKVVIFDRRKVFVGSFNFEPRAHAFNREDGLLIEAPAIAEKLQIGAERLLQQRNCWSVRLDENGDLSWTSHDGTTNESPDGTFRVGTVLFGVVPTRYR